MSAVNAPDGATLEPEHYQIARLRDGEDPGEWLARLVEHAQDFAELQADSTAGRRLVRHAIAGKLTRRKFDASMPVRIPCW